MQMPQTISTQRFYFIGFYFMNLANHKPIALSFLNSLMCVCVCADIFGGLLCVHEQPKMSGKKGKKSQTFNERIGFLF